MSRRRFRYAPAAVSTVEQEGKRHDRRVARFDVRKGLRRSRDWKRARRLRTLGERAPDRRCVSCGETRLASREWVLLDGYIRWLPSTVNAAGALCRRCWWAYKKGT